MFSLVLTLDFIMTSAVIPWGSFGLISNQSHTIKVKAPERLPPFCTKSSGEIVPVFVKWHWTLREGSGSSAGSSAFAVFLLSVPQKQSLLLATPLRISVLTTRHPACILFPLRSPWRQCSWWICTISLLTAKYLLTAWHHGSSEPAIVWIHLIHSCLH